MTRTKPARTEPLETETVLTDAKGRPAPRRRIRAWLLASWPTIAASVLLWVMLWGDLSWANVVSGAVLGAIVAWAFPLPPLETVATVRIGPFLHLVGRFVWDLVFASFQVAWSAVWPGPNPRGAFVTVPLRLRSDLLISTTAGLSSLVPGTFVVDFHESENALTLHVLDLARSGGPEAVSESIHQLEERLLWAFAPRSELVRLGLAPTPRQSPADEEERP